MRTSRKLRPMKKIIFLALFFSWLSHPGFAVESLSPNEEKAVQDQFAQAAQLPGALIFTPPPGWRVADPKQLPPSVKAMVVGKGAGEYPPSLNLATESYGGTLKQY